MINTKNSRNISKHATVTLVISRVLICPNYQYLHVLASSHLGTALTGNQTDGFFLYSVQGLLAACLANEDLQSTQIRDIPNVPAIVLTQTSTPNPGVPVYQHFLCRLSSSSCMKSKVFFKIFVKFHPRC